MCFAFGQTEQSSKQSFVQFNSEMSYKLMEPNENLRKILILAEEFKKDTTKKASLTIGASLITLADYQSSNTDSKFAYLIRHHRIRLEKKQVNWCFIPSSFQQQNWLGIHVEILYNPKLRNGNHNRLEEKST